MKKLFFAISILMWFASVSIAQTDACEGVAFNYEFLTCINNKAYFTHACTDNPTQWASDYNAQHTTQIHPSRWPSGSTIQLCWDENSIATATPGCIDATELSICIEKAMCEWTKICRNAEIDFERSDITTLTHCCVKIQNTTALSDLELDQNSSQIDILSTIAHTLITQDCSGAIKCDAMTKISINNTSIFRKGNVVTYPCMPHPLTGCVTSGKTVVNLCTVLFHEMGHLLGLPHTDFGSQAYPPCNNGASHSDLMFSSIPTADCYTQTTLSQLDKCMFANLYCKGNHNTNHGKNKPQVTLCDYVGVKKPLLNSKQPIIQLYPNPASKP